MRQTRVSAVGLRSDWGGAVNSNRKEGACQLSKTGEGNPKIWRWKVGSDFGSEPDGNKKAGLGKGVYGLLIDSC